MNLVSRRRLLTVGWFGTSIMEHLEGFNARLVTQSNLPPVGSSVTVEGWRGRGYVQRLQLGWQVTWPQVTFVVENRGEGGATSRDVAAIVQATELNKYDLVFLGCGINDVWRGYQGRTAEAVGIKEFKQNYAVMLDSLVKCSRRVICLGETPFGPIDEPDVVSAMNADLVRYNKIAAQVAARAGVLFLDVSKSFMDITRHWAAEAKAKDAQTLWSDGVHLSELGDTLMLHQIQDFLAEHRVISSLLSDQLLANH